MQNFKQGLATLLFIVIAAHSAIAALTPAEIETLISSMTLDEKVSQMTQAERGTASPADVRD